VRRRERAPGPQQAEDLSIMPAIKCASRVHGDDTARKATVLTREKPAAKSSP
jgi:hypothetical protein